MNVFHHIAQAHLRPCEEDWYTRSRHPISLPISETILINMVAIPTAQFPQHGRSPLQRSFLSLQTVQAPRRLLILETILFDIAVFCIPEIWKWTQADFLDTE